MGLFLSGNNIGILGSSVSKKTKLGASVSPLTAADVRSQEKLGGLGAQTLSLSPYFLLCMKLDCISFISPKMDNLTPFESPAHFEVR